MMSACSLGVEASHKAWLNSR